MRKEAECQKCRDMDGRRPLYDPEICSDCPDREAYEAIEPEPGDDDADEEE